MLLAVEHEKAEGLRRERLKACALLHADRRNALRWLLELLGSIASDERPPLAPAEDQNGKLGGDQNHPEQHRQRKPFVR